MIKNRFETCLDFVLKAEGGYTNDPADSGGPTKLGIIQTEYDLYRETAKLPKQSVKLITHGEAKDIYASKYWYAAHCNGLPVGLDLVQFDTAVNMGVGTAIKLLCRTLKVKETTQFTPELSNAIHKLGTTELNVVIKGYLAARTRWYYAIVLRHPKDHEFIKGWLNRISALKKEVGNV